MARLTSSRTGRGPGVVRGTALAAAALVVASVAPSVVGSAAPTDAPGAHLGPSVRSGAVGTSFVGLPSTACPAPAASPQFEAPALPGGARTVALTFDDGPGRSTQTILDILERFHVRATFFNVGQEMVYRPWLVREEAADGFLLGDHTVSHPELTTLSPAAQAAELDGVIHEQRHLVDSSPCVFRPPYGAYDGTTIALARERRMSLWQWNVSTDDWMARGSGSQAWIHHIISVAETEGLATRHAVVLFHNQPISMPATVAALPVVIRFFLEHGYRFVDLLGRTGAPGSCGPATSGSRRVPGRALPAGTSLHAGDAVASPSGQVQLVLAGDGDLALRLATGRQLWASGTAGHPGARLDVETSGDVEVRSASGSTLWSTGTAGNPGASLEVRDDGTLVVATSAGTLWSSGPPLARLAPGERLAVGWRLSSPNDRCRLQTLADGDLVLLDSTHQVLWSTGTARWPGATAVQTTGGDLVVAAGRRLVWRSDTGGHGPTTLQLTDTGQLVITTTTGTRLWVTP